MRRHSASARRDAGERADGEGADGADGEGIGGEDGADGEGIGAEDALLLLDMALRCAHARAARRAGAACHAGSLQTDSGKAASIPGSHSQPT